MDCVLVIYLSQYEASRYLPFSKQWCFLNFIADLAIALTTWISEVIGFASVMILDDGSDDIKFKDWLYRKESKDFFSCWRLGNESQALLL